MKFVEQESAYTYEEKKSKFIAHIFPYNKFDEIMQRLKQEHPKGRHFVYAYRYLNEFDQIVENSSDDGEPKGTSGKPSLKVLAGAELINSGVIIVRYFGGIKLGTGGLVRAYSDAVNLAIENSRLKEYRKLIEKKLEIEYDELSKIEYTISRLGIDIINKSFGSNVCLYLASTDEEFKKLSKELPLGVELV